LGRPAFVAFRRRGGCFLSTKTAPTTIRRNRAITLTAQAQSQLGPFIERASTRRLVVRCVFEEETSLTISLDDVAAYYATEARNLTSGCRTLAGLTGDWRYVDQLARLALDWFKRVNTKGMRAAARRHGIEPRF
jgi:hypothetical protein